MSVPQHLYFVHSVYSFNGYALGFYCKPYPVLGENEQMNSVINYRDTFTELEVLWGTQ